MYNVFCLFSESNPNTYEEAIKTEEWKSAIHNELEAHKKFGTWVETIMPKGKKAIDTKWIFTTKDNGTKKARLVARGFQEESKPGETLYSPVARISTVRMLLSLAQEKDWSVRQLDIPTAYLNGHVQSEIYIKAPKGLRTESKILKLQRPLYGIKEASKCWNLRFNTFAIKNGFERSKNDFCLNTKKGTYMIIYVDDILITGENIQETVDMLKKEFCTKDFGEITDFLGIQVERTASHMKLFQKKMINKILTKFGMEECNGSKTPMETNFQDDGQEEIIKVPYRELVGSLLYISNATRPDITHSVSYLSQFLDKPNQKTWIAAKRVLRYLKETQNYGLIYKKKLNSKTLYAFSDADWAGNVSDRKSITGCVAYYFGNTVSWISRKQNSVSLSSTEAEYIAAATSTAEMVYLKGIAEDMDNGGKESPIIYIDNRGAIDLSKSYENSKRSKHIDIKYHFIKDMINKNIINVQHVKTEDNIADILTKSLSHIRFSKLRRGLELDG